MSSLFWKGMLAFLAVIIVAVGTVAVLTGRVTETAFRRYALTRSGMWEGPTTSLAAYHEAHGSWESIQDAIAEFPDQWPRMKGREGAPGGPPRMIDFRIVDTQGRIVGDTRGSPRGSVSQADLDNSVPIEADGEIVGYLIPAPVNPPAWPLDAPQAAFLARVRRILWVATLAALSVALVIGGLLFRSITAPLRKLTDASQAIAKGDLSARAQVRGQDEVAQLATSFNEMAESLARAEEARQNQTADIAHELRTPLTVIQGTLEAMLDGVYLTDRENMQAALTQTRTLSRLVEDLRILALADAGRLELHTTSLDLKAFLEKMVDAHQPRFRNQDTALALETPAALPSISADQDRLAQVMGNLLANVLQYVPKGGHVTVRARKQEQEVTVAVIDDGPGVPTEDLPHLFERFWRADPARRRATGGSGLGLSIARHVVEAHGGHIWAEETPGGGLTVAFSLPTARETKT